MYRLHLTKETIQKIHELSHEHSLYSTDGKLIYSNIQAIKTLTQKLNEEKDFSNTSEIGLRTGEICAIGLLEELKHILLNNVKKEYGETIFVELFESIKEEFTEEEVYNVFYHFINNYPPDTVLTKKKTIRQELDEILSDETKKAILLEELTFVWLNNENETFKNYKILFDDKELRKTTKYKEFVNSLLTKIDSEIKIEDEGAITFLKRVEKEEPNSLKGQLEYVKENWEKYITNYSDLILTILDIIKEEETFRGGGPGDSPILRYYGLEYEAYSQDKEWIPNVVLIAKNSYVWLDQLSKKYNRPIYHLDHIPDEELEILASRGFTGLWLIGVWERSKASKRIKQMCGNPEAEASAYSLYDYSVAQDLGGYEAYHKLKERAWKKGIRLASDMVPNHMGIDSKWIKEHPEWFVSLPYSPFPSYSFSGQNLSENHDYQIYLEDHYYSRTDAAVVFKHIDNRTGETRFIYHGNDGTSMPWNDTAQLDYLRKDVRDTVINTIIHVAKLFPIIRFDAAMTLTKMHFQRLWFPEPGTGGAIPSRAGLGLTQDKFDELMPKEFWREVVDRVTEEAPDTLLLAEAFWLLEGYFVRTLGMHRVYNSAFMNMLKMEENSKYRDTVKNTLEFDPQILRRFVNFMNNPDEETAYRQFGKGDKYFGVCILLATMPGLPMFGHGQIEGFSEKYGMEYRKAYYDEREDEGFVSYHKKTVFPLLRKRYLFAEVENFYFYNLDTRNGVNEDVFAYSNMIGEEKALIIYHNKYNFTSGWIKYSVAYNSKSSESTDLKHKTIAEGLNISRGEKRFLIFKDLITDLEYIRKSTEFCDSGLYIELGGYKYHVFMDFKEVEDDELNYYENIYNKLSGNGVLSIQEEYDKLILKEQSSAKGEIEKRGK